MNIKIAALLRNIKLTLRHPFEVMLRLTSGQWTDANGSLTRLGQEDNLPRILYKSDHFVVINKRFDLKVNSDDPAADPVTVATQLRALYPEAVDRKTAHGFRYMHKFVQILIIKL
jgi:hypothetical protein